MESDQKHLTSLTNIPPKSTLSKTSSSESSSSEISLSSGSSSSESSFSSETSSSESSSSDLDYDYMTCKVPIYSEKKKIHKVKCVKKRTGNKKVRLISG